jgi:hypothetical protein
MVIAEDFPQSCPSMLGGAPYVVNRHEIRFPANKYGNPVDPGNAFKQRDFLLLVPKPISAQNRRLEALRGPASRANKGAE